MLDWRKFAMKKNTYRIPLGFIAGAVFLWRAHPDLRMFLVGAALMAFGEAIRFISAGTLVKFEGVTREGIYAFLRNPLYTGSFFIGLGACIMGRDLWFTAFFLVAYPVVYYRIIRREEEWLIGRYGDDYRNYLAEVPRIFPRKFPTSAIFTSTAPFLAVKNRELKTVAGVLFIWLFMALKMLIG